MRGKDGKPIQFKFSSFFYLDKGRQNYFCPNVWGQNFSIDKIWIKQYIGIFIVQWIRLIPLPRGITLIKGSSTYSKVSTVDKEATALQISAINKIG